MPGKITFSGGTLSVVTQVSNGSHLGGITAYLSKTQFSIQCGSNPSPTTIGSPTVVITTPGATAAAVSGGSAIRMQNTDIGLKFNYDLNFPPMYHATYGGVMFRTPLFHTMTLQQGVTFNATAYSGATLFLNLVALGSIHAGERIPAGIIGRVVLTNIKDSANPDEFLKLYDIEFASDLVTDGKTCDVGNMTVPLGTRELLGIVGHTTPAVPFRIMLYKCPEDTRIFYRIDPTTSIVSPAPTGAGASVMALDTSSSATGVGIQLLHDNLTPHPLGTVMALGQMPVGGGSMPINLHARYIKIAPLVAPGTANSSATITLSYQ